MDILSPHKDLLGKLKTQLNKNTSVQGTTVEKILFYVVFLASVSMFCFSSINLTISAGTATITTVDFTTHEPFYFPGMFVCTPNTMNYTSATGEAGFEFEMPPLAGTGHTCSRSALQFASKVVSDQNGSIHANPKEMSCVQMDMASSKAVKLTQYVNAIMFPVTLTCLLLNDDGALTADRNDPLTFIFHEGHNAPSLQHPGTMMLIGLYDTSLDADRITKEKFKYFIIDPYASTARLEMEYDERVDLTGESLSFGVPTFKANKEKAVKFYKARVTNSKYDIGYQMHAHSDHDTIPEQIAPKPNRIMFMPGDFVGRKMLLYRKSLTETWSDLGGCWASALLLVSAFFVTKSSQGQDGVTVNTRIFRFRTPGSQRELLRRLAKGEPVAEAAGKLPVAGFAEKEPSSPRDHLRRLANDVAKVQPEPSKHHGGEP